MVTNRSVKKEKPLRSCRESVELHRGFAMVFAIFLVVGLETVIAGNMFNMMRHHRQVQRQVHRTQLVWVGDGIIDRAIKLFRDYLITQPDPEFPNVDIAGGRTIVRGDNSRVTDGRTFSQFLKGWYEGRYRVARPGPRDPGFQQRDKYKPILERIHLVTPPEIIEIPDRRPDPNDLKRWYQIIVHLRHELTQVQTRVIQEIVVDKSCIHCLNFFNEDLEIAAGPEFSLQGPIFSNKNIYLSTGKKSTLILKLPDDGNTPDNPDPFALQAHGNIYFWFKRAIGENYQRYYGEFQKALDTGGLPSYYHNPNELMTFVNLSTNPVSYAPVFYYFFNRTEDEGTWGDDPRGAEGNTILVETVPGGCRFGTVGGACLELPHPGKKTRLAGGPQTFVVFGENGSPNLSTDPFPFRAYGGYEQYVTQRNNPFAYFDYVFMDNFWIGFDGNKMNLSAAIERNNPTLTPPPINPNWLQGQGFFPVLKDGVPMKTVPIGTPNHPSGPHLIIEPLTDLVRPSNLCRSDSPEQAECYPLDTEEVMEHKFQYKAQHKELDSAGRKTGLDLYVISSAVGGFGTCSEDLQTLIDKKIVQDNAFVVRDPNTDKAQCGGFVSMMDYRLLDKDPMNMIEIDMGKLITEYPNIELIYVYTAPVERSTSQTPVLVKLVNGSKLPRKGLTVATNGRLWIEGDYNTFEYLNDYSDEGHYCGTGEWDERQCSPPPAAIFSDSFGVLSNEWKDFYEAGGYRESEITPLSSRRVEHDVTVNVAILTGLLGSQLERVYSPESCSGPRRGDGYCGNLELVKIPDGGYYNRGEFFCADDSYALGKDGVSQSCEFYQDPVTKLLYVNPKSTGAPSGNPTGDIEQLVRYQEAMVNPPVKAGDPQPVDGNRNPIVGDVNHLLPYCNAEINDGSKDDCDHIRIPIVVTPDSASRFLTEWKNSKRVNWSDLEGVRPFDGVSYRSLLRNYLFGYTNSEQRRWICNADEPTWSPCEGVPGGQCPVPGGDPTFTRCNNAGDANEAECRQCKGKWSDPVLVNTTYPQPYLAPIHRNLWKPRYSGGLESGVVNLQEEWIHRTLRVLGTFSSPWAAKELKVGYQPAYWKQDYFNAPRRIFDFNETLRIKSPPDSPGLFSIKRERWQERAPNS